jgi:hypothetical protein
MSVHLKDWIKFLTYEMGRQAAGGEEFVAGMLSRRIRTVSKCKHDQALRA